MNRSFSIGIILVIMTTFSILNALADEPTIQPWQLIGGQDALLNGLCSSGNLLFATTEEGFHLYNSQTGNWTDRTWPGWIGRAKYSVLKGRYNDDRLVSGGVNAWFKGTLFYSDDDGQNETLVLESNGGKVTDLAASIELESTLYACTWSDIVDGELLRSNDNGQSWSLITGHGHHSMIDVAVIGSEEVYLAGDNYISMTTNAGLTWENLQGNLPDNQGIYCLLAQPQMTGLPTPSKTEPNIDLLLASNDSGLYLYQFETAHWEMVLPFSCRSIGHRVRQTDTFVYWSETYAVTWDHRVMFCKDRDWENWQDVTAELVPGTPIDIEVNSWGVFVAMLGGGVFRTDGHSPLSDTPNPTNQLQLSIFPNPFNPTTTIKYDLPVSGKALVQVFDIRGALVATLVDEEVSAGLHTRSWHPTGLSSGVYRVLFTTGGQTKFQQIVLLK